MMRINVLTLCIALCCLSFEAIAQDLPNYISSEGLMGWYAMDGNALDFSSNQSNGSLDGAVAGVNRSGETDSALSFGMGANESVSRMVLPGLVTDVSDSFSVAFWGKPTESVIFPIQGQTGNEIPPNGQVIIHPIHGHFFGPDSAHAGFGVALATNGLSLIEHSDAWQTAPIVIQEDLSDWHHYAVVYADGVSSVYIDGAWAASGGQSDRSIHISFGTDPWYPAGGIGHGYQNRRYFGQLDDMAFWNRSLSAMEVNSLFLEQLLIPGCTDESACNYTSDASFQDDSCIYPPEGIADCETGGVFCGDGTIWDANIQACVVSEFCQEDLDGDGVIGINDLMQLLSSFGTMCPIWMCGDPVNYYGYDYTTVQIGEQCWFAENCRHLAAVSPPSLGFEDDSLAHAYVQGYDGASVDEAMTMENYALHGVLYNQLAAESWDICPTGWHVPIDANIPQQGDFEELKLALPANAIGTALKASPTDVPPWDGNNSSGFKGISSGARSLYWDGEFSWLDVTAFYWSQSGWSRRLDSNDENLSLMGLGPAWGLSVRCIKDTEE
jgi:uncharacterized protein (TIGR02145 family)